MPGIKGHHAGRAAGYDGSVKATDSSTSSPTAEQLIERSAAARTTGRHEEGLQWAEQALARLGDHADPALLAQAMSERAEHLWRLGRFEEAVPSAREAAARWADIGGARHAEILCLLALALTELGLHEEALKAATAAFDEAQACELVRQQVLALNRIGTCYERLGDPAQGEHFLRQALEQARALDDDEEVMRAANNLAATTIGAHYHYRQADRLDDAQQALVRGRGYAEQALVLARRSGDNYRIAVTLGNLAELLGLAGDYATSHRLNEETLALCRANGYRAPELRTQHNIGEILLLEGRVEEAIGCLEATLAELKPLDQQSTHLRVHSALYRAYKQAGRHALSLQHCEAFHQMEYQRAIQQREAQTRLMVHRVEVALARSESERAKLAMEVERLRRRELEAEKAELEQRAAALERDTREDQLTRLGNRRRVDDDLPRLVERAQQDGRRLCLAVADIDHFKRVNDAHGHGLGDEVLRIVAQAFRERTRAADLVARIGGEEFLIAFVDAPLPTARAISERLRSAVERHRWALLRPDLSVTISIGLAELRDGETAQQLIERADRCLYQAKRAGRNLVRTEG